MRWTRPTWQATLPEHHDLLASLPDVIDRSTVTKRAAGAADGDAPAVQAFVTAMVWGYGPAGYGAFRTARVGWAGENGDKERYNQLAPKHHYYYKSS